MQTLTHGMAVKSVHEGVQREIGLQRYVIDGDVQFLVRIVSSWPDDQESKETKVWFSEDGFAIFCKFMQLCPARLENYKV
jgi:hypothetical protein